MTATLGILVVDMQGDFTQAHNGPLAAGGTDQAYIQSVREACSHYRETGLPLYATQDWHPANHVSFAANNPGAEVFSSIELEGRSQVMWPMHCVQNTAGAELLLPEDWFEAVLKKGTDPRFDSYSGFADDGGAKTGLEEILQKHGVEELIIFGLATDYCVKFTVLDALNAGFAVQLRPDLCREVDPQTGQQALQEMEEAGAKKS